MITGTEFGNRISSADPLEIIKSMDELSVLKKKDVDPRKHLQPLKFLLEKNFHEDARKGILSIILLLREEEINKKGI